MPAATERRLKKRASKLYPHNTEKQNRYVYGTMNKIKKRHDRKLARTGKGRSTFKRR